MVEVFFLRIGIISLYKLYTINNKINKNVQITYVLTISTNFYCSITYFFSCKSKIISYYFVSNKNITSFIFLKLYE